VRGVHLHHSRASRLWPTVSMRMVSAHAGNGPMRCPQFASNEPLNPPPRGTATVQKGPRPSRFHRASLIPCRAYAGPCRTRPHRSKVFGVNSRLCLRHPNPAPQAFNSHWLCRIFPLRRHRQRTRALRSVLFSVRRLAATIGRRVNNRDDDGRPPQGYATSALEV
jgi:hypothetical protein